MCGVQHKEGQAVTNFKGRDDLREWLIVQGFKVSLDSITRDNGCNWYAYRRSAIPARECECNDGKPMQIVVRPYLFLPSGGRSEHRSTEVDVTGEAGGVWFKLSAYSLRDGELQARLPDIEASLIAAWNALTKETP
jgi:hypothetical protein